MRDKLSQLYVVTNHADGPEKNFHYVGVSVNPQRRWGEHLKDSGFSLDGSPSGKGLSKGACALHEAIARFGPENFSFETYGEIVPRSYIEQESLEDKLIEKLRSRIGDRGYNMMTGGSNGIPDVGTWLKVVHANREKAKNPAYRAKRKAAAQKMATDPEWLTRRKAIAQKLAQDPVYRAIRKATNQKMFQDPLWREAVARGNRQKAQTPEWRLKVSEGTKAGWKRRQLRKALESAKNLGSSSTPKLGLE